MKKISVCRKCTVTVFEKFLNYKSVILTTLVVLVLNPRFLHINICTICKLRWTTIGDWTPRRRAKADCGGLIIQTREIRVIAIVTSVMSAVECVCAHTMRPVRIERSADRLRQLNASRYQVSKKSVLLSTAKDINRI